MDFVIVQFLHTSTIDIQDKPLNIHVGHYGRLTVTNTVTYVLGLPCPDTK
jgi:hypothetical protein